MQPAGPDPHHQGGCPRQVTNQEKLPGARGKAGCANLPPASPLGECDKHPPATGNSHVVGVVLCHPPFRTEMSPHPGTPAAQGGRISKLKCCHTCRVARLWAGRAHGRAGDGAPALKEGAGR